MNSNRYKSSMLGVTIGWIGIIVTTIIMLLVTCQPAQAQRAYEVQYESQATVKLYKVKYESQANYKYWIAPYISQAMCLDSKCLLHHWFYVKYPSQAELKIWWVKYPSQADYLVYEVKYPSQAH